MFSFVLIFFRKIGDQNTYVFSALLLISVTVFAIFSNTVSFVNGIKVGSEKAEELRN